MSSLKSKLNFNFLDSQAYRIDKTIEVFEFCKDLPNRFKNGSILVRKQILDTLGSHWTLLDGKLSVELDPAYKATQKLASQEWINDSRFPTLATRIEPGFDAETCQLIKNGGGGEVLPPASNSFQQRRTTSVVYGSAILPFA